MKRILLQCHNIQIDDGNHFHGRCLLIFCGGFVGFFFRIATQQTKHTQYKANVTDVSIHESILRVILAETRSSAHFPDGIVPIGEFEGYMFWKCWRTDAGK